MYVDTRAVSQISGWRALPSLPETTVALAALLISIVLATSVLTRGGRDLGMDERLGVIALGIYLPLVVGITLGGIPTGGYGDVPEPESTDWGVDGGFR